MSDEEPTQRIADVLALSESTVSKERQEGVVNVLADPDELKRFSNLKKREPKEYAKLLYLVEDVNAIEKWETNGGDYSPPEMSLFLVEPDLNLRTSSDGLLIKVFKSISHLTEGGSSGGRTGWFGRKKG